MHPDLRTTRASDAELSRHLVDAGYEIMYKDSINTVFVRGQKHREILAAG